MLLRYCVASSRSNRHTKRLKGILAPFLIHPIQCRLLRSNVFSAASRLSSSDMAILQSPFSHPTIQIKKVLLWRHPYYSDKAMLDPIPHPPPQIKMFCFDVTLILQTRQCLTQFLIHILSGQVRLRHRPVPEDVPERKQRRTPLPGLPQAAWCKSSIPL
jgi:hypothetical protein